MNARPHLNRSGLLALAAILVVAAGVRFWGIAFGLPFGYARPDETYVMDVVRPLLEGRAPPPNYEYPWLYMGLTALGWLAYYPVGAAQGAWDSLAGLTASWRVHPTPFFLINRAITAALGTLTVVVVFAVARRLWTTRAALVASALLAVAYLHVRDSHYGTTDVPMTFFVLLATWLALRAHDRGGIGDYAWAGVAAGLAGATKYNAVFVVLPLIVSAVVHAARRGVLAGVIRLTAAGVPCALVAALGIPFAVTDPARFVQALSLLFASTTAGQAHLDLPPGWMTHLQYSLRYGLGAALLLVGLAGVVVVAWRDGTRGVLLVAFPVAYFAVVGAAANQYYRYMVPVVPFICLAAAGAIHHLLAVLAARGALPAGPAAATAIPAVLVAFLVAEPAWRTVTFDMTMTATDNRVVVADWITSNVPPGSSILVTGSHYGHPWLPADRGYRFWVWDRRERRYWSPDDDNERPEWVLRQEHPLSADQPVVGEWLADGYAMAWRFAAARDDGRTPVYDRMDAFYLPYAGFAGVSRPGPSFTLFRRVR